MGLIWRKYAKFQICIYDDIFFILDSSWYLDFKKIQNQLSIYLRARSKIQNYSCIDLKSKQLFFIIFTIDSFDVYCIAAFLFGCSVYCYQNEVLFQSEHCSIHSFANAIFHIRVPEPSSHILSKGKKSSFSISFEYINCTFWVSEVQTLFLSWYFDQSCMAFKGSRSFSSILSKWKLVRIWANIS